MPLKLTGTVWRTDKASSKPRTSPKQLILESGFQRLIRAKHGLFLYNKNDLFVGRSLETYGEWCERELDVLLPIIRPHDVIMDVGANIGTHAVPFARKVGPGGFVYAFEPQRAIFQTLCANLSLNCLLNVKCLMVGAGKQRGTLKIPVLDPEAEQNFGAVNIENFAEGETTDIISIDSLGLQRCRLIKIDVEGMESEVLIGAIETIKRLRPVLFVENNTEAGSGKIIQNVLDLNYRSFWHVAPYFNPGNYFGCDENIFSRFQPEANLLCIPREVEANVSAFEPV